MGGVNVEVSRFFFDVVKHAVVCEVFADGLIKVFFEDFFDS